MSPPHPVTLRSAVTLALLCVCLFFYRAGDRPLNSSHEARAAQNGQSILLNNDWLLPQLFDREVELQKPPLYYWLVACFGWLRGGKVDAWAVRLPAVLSALGCVLTVFELCRQRGRPLAGLLAGCILATCIHFTWLARVGRIDMPLTFVTTLTLAAFYLGLCRRREKPERVAWPWFVVGYVALGVGLLLKGPIAAVLPVAVGSALVLVQWLTRPQPRIAFTPPALAAWGLWWGIPLVLLIALPWYLYVNLVTHGDLFRVFFWYHNFARGFGGAEALVERPWWFYGPMLARDLLPWSPALLIAAWFFLRRNLWRVDSLAGLGFVWLVAVALLLSCFRFKRAEYLLPAYPGAALFLGCMLERAWRHREHFQITLIRRWLPAAFGVTVAGCAVGWVVFITWFIPTHDSTAEFARQVRDRTKDVVLQFRVEDHELAYHLGPAVTTLLEWENLDTWLAHRPSARVIMPESLEAECPRKLHNASLRRVLAHGCPTTHQKDRSLVLLGGFP